MRRGSVCCKVADHHQSSGLGRTTSSVSVSLEMFNAPRNHRFRMYSARGEPPKRPKRWLQRKFVVRSRHCSIGRRRWRRVGHSSELIAGSGSSSGEAYRRLFPVHRKGQEEGRCGEHNIAESSGIEASVRRRSGRETSQGVATRSGKVRCCSINGESIRWPSCEAVSAGGFRTPLRRGHAGMDAGTSCRSPSGRCGRTSPGSGESFPAPHHCCSGVAGVDQPTVGCNATFRCKCRGINGAVMRFTSMRLRRRWGSRGVRVGEASQPGPSSFHRQSRLLKREGPFRRCRLTQIDSNCEPLVNRGRFGVLSSDSDDEGLAVSVCRAPHAMERGTAVPVSEGCPHVPKRLRLFRNRCRPSGALEHNLICSERDVPPPMCPPFDWPSTERGSIREDGRSGLWAVVKGRGPKISQQVFPSHGCGPSQFTATKFVPGSSVRGCRRSGGCGRSSQRGGTHIARFLPQVGHRNRDLSRTRGRRCVNRFSGRFRIHCSTAGMGRPSVSAHTSWFCCSGFDQCAGHFTHRACVMKVPPAFLRGAFRSAMRLSL